MGLAEKLQKNVQKAGKVQQVLNNLMAGSVPGSPPSLVQQPDAAVPPGSAVGLTPEGVAGIPDAEPGFLATWWPVLAALAIAGGAYIWFDLGVWWAIGLAIVAWVVLDVGRSLLG